MNARVDHLIDEVLALPAEERSAVAAALIDSLSDGEPDDIAQAWREELRQRWADLHAGAVKGQPWVEARARLSAL